MILVTGGAGYIGSHTVVELLKDNKEVLVADNFCNSSKDVIKNIEKISGKPVQCIEIDLKNTEEVRAKLSPFSITGIIHFAAHKAVGESVEKAFEYYQNNLISLLNVLEISKIANVENFIFSSSATVYGNIHGEFISESQPVVESSNPYGQSKIIGEKIISDIARNSETNFISLRYFNPIGADPSGLIGDNPNGTPTNLMPFISKVAAGELDKLEVFGDDYSTKDGTCIRDYIHVSDLANAHVKALNFENSSKEMEVFNIGTGFGTSVLELIEAFEIQNELKIKKEITTRRPGDVGVLYSNPTKAKELLDWKAQLSIQEMVKSSWNFQKKNKK